LFIFPNYNFYLENGADQGNVDFNNLEDLTKYIQTLSNIAEQNQVRLGLANHNLEMTDEISSTGSVHVITFIDSNFSRQRSKDHRR
jgi:hypothetical protein